MADTTLTPEHRFANLIELLAAEPDVTPPSDAPGAEGRFGAAALKVNNRIFAMLSRDRLVVKLPRARVDALVASGEGERFDPRNDGRLMKEWLILNKESGQSWEALAREALEFVR